ncbi:hypothetical protein Dvina_21980 [Dactylosporangium vinaceum]|uniref:Uncharacterized protein n=1 Tax=Dactylosporangium vinaceum TaxID=53362 RepID=A0ABV5MRC6_9ACTN|nr:hypothetical protein [Dactylosporangium vinaceum]UAC00482.1 hypothetical protein Dvina_21980 [Dactylosporangium vinaceum]
MRAILRTGVSRRGVALVLLLVLIGVVGVVAAAAGLGSRPDRRPGRRHGAE